MTAPTRIAALASALALALACGRHAEAPAEAGKPVVVTPVSVRAVDERIEASGELLAKQHADVAAQVGGEITEILFEEGDAVAEGDVVMEIDPEKRKLELSRVQAGVEAARAALAEAEREIARVKALAETNVASKTRLDQAQTALQTAGSRLQGARAELGVAERALRDASVRARFSGLMSRRDVSRGEFVREGQTLFELVSLDPIEVEFHLPEADAARVGLGMKIEVGVAPYPGELFEATVHVVSPTIDRKTRTLRVRALIENADGRLRPGLFARANLGVARREGVILVPEEAVQQRADGAVVFRVLDGNRVRAAHRDARQHARRRGRDPLGPRAGRPRRLARPRGSGRRQPGQPAPARRLAARGRGRRRGLRGTQRGGGAMNLIDLCIERPILTLMLTLSLLVFGALGYRQLGVDQLPNMEFPVVTVTAQLEGAAPEVMEEDVTEVLEEHLNTIGGTARAALEHVPRRLGDQRGVRARARSRPGHAGRARQGRARALAAAEGARAAGGRQDQHGEPADPVDPAQLGSPAGRGDRVPEVHA